MAKPTYTPRQMVAVIMIDRLIACIRDSDEIQHGAAGYKKRVQALAVKMVERLGNRYKLEYTIPEIDSGGDASAGENEEEDLIG